MRRSPPSHGVVCLPSLDVRARPAHQGEMRSQLLIGEVVRVLERGRGGRWRRVENLADGYSGWVRAWGLVETSKARALRWLRLARTRVVSMSIEMRSRPGGGRIVSPLYLGGRVIPGPARGRWRRVELPDARRGWVRSSGLGVEGRPPTSLAARVGDLMGVPYLWGGRTPFGLDCSGFTQLVFAEQGVPLPRDSRDQFRESSPLAGRERPRAGDLVFFGRRGSPASHVGIAMGGAYYVHVQGHVRLASLDPANPLYDKLLSSQFMAFRRPRRARGGGSSKVRGDPESA